MTFFRLRAIVAATFLFGLGSLVGAPTLAWGQEPTAGGPSELPPPSQTEATVVLMFDPHEDDSLALVGSIAAHLAGVPVRLIHEPRARTELLTWLGAGRSRVKATRSLGLFAVDVSRRDGWRLFFLEPDGVPTLIRRLKPTPEHAPLDEAGITVRLLVEALLDGKHVEVTEPVLGEEPAEAGGTSPSGEPAPRKPPASGSSSSPRPAAPSPGSVSDASGSATNGAPQAGARGVYLAALVGLSTTKWLSSEGWQSGILTGAALYVDRAWSLSLDYVWYPKLRYQASDAAITLSRHPFAGRVSYRPSPGFSPIFCVGTWFDAISRQTVDANQGFHSTASTIEPAWGMNASAGLSSPRLSILSVRLDLGLDVAARNVSYIVRNETDKTVVATSAVRPFLGVLMDFRL